MGSYDTSTGSEAFDPFLLTDTLAGVTRKFPPNPVPAPVRGTMEAPQGSSVVMFLWGCAFGVGATVVLTNFLG